MSHITFIDKNNMLDTFNPSKASLKENGPSILSFDVCCFGTWYAGGNLRQVVALYLHLAAVVSS